MEPMALDTFLSCGWILFHQDRFFQLFEWKQWVYSTIGLLFKKKGPKGTNGRLTQLQAMATSLGATVGTSSIAGVATAIFFWRAGRRVLDVDFSVFRDDDGVCRKSSGYFLS